MIVGNLGFHLLVQSSAVGMVAVCLHPLDLAGQDFAHGYFSRRGIEFAAPDEPVVVGCLDQWEAQGRAAALAFEMTRGVEVEAAKLLGVTAKTLRKWERGG